MNDVISRTIGIDCRLWAETGVGRYIRNLVRELQNDKKNSYVIFVLSKDKSDVFASINNTKWKIVVADVPWHTLTEQIIFPKILQKENVDIMHFPYFSVPLFYNKPFIMTVHDLILHHFPTGKASTKNLFVYWVKLFFYKLLLQINVFRAKKILTVSNATKDEIIQHLHIASEKVVVAYNGVEQIFLENKKQKPLFPFPYFLYVGNAYPHKNVETLLDACRQVLQKKDMKLVLVGKEDFFYKKIKQKIHRRIIDKHTVFISDASDENVLSLYQHATALILPSFMEGFGLSAIEAMATGCPVIASDIPSLREVCKTSAIYFQSTDANELSEKLFGISSFPAEKRKEEQQRAQIFSWIKMAEDVLDIYESCTRLR